MKRKLTQALSFLLLLQVFPALAQNWKPIGPFNRQNTVNGQINSQGGGRMNAIAFDKNYLLNGNVYAGAHAGGFWYTSYNSTLQTCTWANSGGLNSDNLPVTSGQMPACGVSAIAMDPIASNTIYIAGKTLRYGALGVYKNVNQAGWVATGLTFNIPNTVEIYSLTAHDDGTSTTILLASTSNGVYRSSNGGTSWSLVLTNGTGLSFDKVTYRPGSNTEVYAIGREVYKSTNAGLTWTQVSTFASSFYPSGTIQEGTLAVASNGTMYASLFVIDPGNLYNTGGWPAAGSTIVFLRYDPTLSTWQQINMFGFYFDIQISRMHIAIDPSNPDYVFATQEAIHRYNNTTGTWDYNASCNDNYIHADVQDLQFAPDGSLWIATDGGISVAQTLNASGIPTAWKPQNTGMNNTLVVGFAGAQTDPDFYLVGEDDNGNSISSNADPLNFSTISWTGYSPGDGKEKYIDYDDGNNWYDDVSAYGPWIKRTTSGNPFLGWHYVFDETDPWAFRNFGFNQPIVQHPYLPNIIYKANDFLMRSFDYGETAASIFKEQDCGGSWYSVVTSIAISRANPDYLYFSLYNNQNTPYTPRVLKTTQATTMPGVGLTCSGTYWADISPPVPSGLGGPPYPLEYAVSALASSDYDPNKVWASFAYYNPNKIGSNKVMYYNGSAWSDYSNGLPSYITVYSMVYETGSNDGLYIGTNSGVYYRNASMTSWIPFMTNLPATEVRDMEINYGENTIRAAAYGRGIWSSPLYCPSLYSITESGAYLVDKFAEAEHDITATMINTNINKIIYRAGAYIDIQPSSEAAPSGSGMFYAFIHGCNTPGNTFRSADDAGASPVTELDEKEKAIETAPDLVIYPNPGDGVFYLSRKPDTDKPVEIFDLLGQRIPVKLQYTDGSCWVDMNGMSNGIYIVKAVVEGKPQVLRIVKQ